MVGVWIVTYWLYEPRRTVSIDPPATLTGEYGGAVAGTEGSGAPRVTLDPEPTQQAIGVLAPPKSTAANAPAPAPVRTRRVLKILKPEFREYVVQKGDVSLKAVAARKDIFGDARKWQAISRMNPHVSPDKLKPGVTVLKIPLDPDNTQGKEVWVDEPIVETAGGSGGTGPGEAPGARPAASQPSAEPAGKTYTIQREDTLWEISKKFYGRGGAWRTIYEANRALIPNPDRPPTGVTITIPAEP